MKYNVKLGLVCLARNTFDFNAAAEIYRGIVKDLSAREDLTLVAIDGVIMDADEAARVGAKFASERVDAIAVISGTFHLGHLALEIKKRCDKPLLLWGLPELPYNGGKIRLNSVCGVNLNASNLVKSGYSDFVYTVSESIDEAWLDAVRMIAALKEAHIGILGSRAHGFFNVGTDELALYRKFGCITDYYELSEVYNVKEDDQTKQSYARRIEDSFNLGAINAVQKDKVAALCAKLKAFIDGKGLSALAIRCWPEFAAGFGIAPCASMSLLQDDGYILACEGDVDCAVTMICHKAAGASTPFMADISQVNVDEDTALMWHCGVAPRSLCDGVCTPTLDTYFAGGKGVTAGFVMKEGEMSVARLDSVNGKYRLFTESGKALPMEKQLTGTYAKVRLGHKMSEVLDRVVYGGLAHHVSMVYGDYTAAFDAFARLTATEKL